MRMKTLGVLWKRGQLRLLWTASRLAQPYYRIAWLTAATRIGLLGTLREGPVSLSQLVSSFSTNTGDSEGLRTWLEMGVTLRELARTPEGYALQGYLARQLADPGNDEVAAIVEEICTLHHSLLLETPGRLIAGNPFNLSDQNGVLIARASRILEPFVQESIDDILLPRGPVRLLEVGAGSGTYIRYTVERNPNLTALGLELQPEVADLANNNLRDWQLADRAKVDVSDVRDRAAEPAFDLVTLHNNIYYFTLAERVALLTHLRNFLVPGGTLLVTTGCQGGSPTMQALDIWSANTSDCGRLPGVAELSSQIREAGFTRVSYRRLIPAESYYAFYGRK